MKIKPEDLSELISCGNIVEDLITSERRWHTQHEIVFQTAEQIGTDDGWWVCRDRPATEMQDVENYGFEVDEDGYVIGLDPAKRSVKMIETVVWEL